jgi:cytochrome c553
MKRIFALTLLAVLAACGGGEPPAETPATDAEAAPAAAVAGFDAAATFNTVCATCHGVTGVGDGPAGAALDPKPASFADAAFWETRTDEDVFAVIKEGGAARGKSPLMVGWGMSYDDTQITALVEHIKTLQGS